MKRNSFIAILSFSLGAGLVAQAQETNANAGLSWSSFESISENNIFDTTRRGTAVYGNPSRVRTPVVRAFTYHGTIDAVALFTGDGAPKDGYVKEGDLINGFKVMQITLHYVKLAQPNGDIVVLKEDDTMRREEEGPWTKSDQPPPLVIAISSEVKSDESSGSPSPAPAGESDILKRLRLKREQEDK
jgi:hypothetical protein